MAPKAPPKPPPPKNAFERFSDYLDSDQGKQRTKVLVSIFFVLAVVMTYLYKIELTKSQNLIKAVASIRQFAVDYEPSLHGKTDMEILAAVHLFTLHLLNLTLRNEELDNELKTLTEIIPGWVAFEKNLYFFSTTRKTWQGARDDCLARHTADLVSCRYSEEQAFIDELANEQKHDIWLGLRKNSSSGRLTWLAGYSVEAMYWSRGEPNGGDNEQCLAVIPSCKRLTCWYDSRCNDQRYFCCKMTPNPKWLD